MYFVPRSVSVAGDRLRRWPGEVRLACATVRPFSRSQLAGRAMIGQHRLPFYSYVLSPL